jgi:hypothetical protein
MNSTSKTLIAILGFTACLSVQAVSVVYNLRIAETTRRQAQESSQKRSSIAATTFFAQFREIHDGAHQKIGGAVGTYLFSPSNYYLRADCAVGHVYTKKDSFHFSRTQADDILFSAGRSHAINERTRVTGSAMLGVPTHKDSALEGLQFGTGHFGLGVQLDGGHVYSKNFRHSIMGATRYIRFLNRKTTFNFNSRDLNFRIELGNLIDLFVSHQSRFGKRHNLEFGYNPTFSFGAGLKPRLFDVQTSFIRSSFYGSYRYLFLIKKVPSAISIGLSYSFDHLYNVFAIKSGVTSWITWGLNF